MRHVFSFPSFMRNLKGWIYTYSRLLKTTRNCGIRLPKSQLENQQISEYFRSILGLECSSSLFSIWQHWFHGEVGHRATRFWRVIRPAGAAFSNSWDIQSTLAQLITWCTLGSKACHKRQVIEPVVIYYASKGATEIEFERENPRHLMPWLLESLEHQQPWYKRFYTEYPSLSSNKVKHYSDVIMSAMVSQVTAVSIICSTRLFRRRSKKTAKLCVTGFCEGNPPVIGGFPSQRSSNAKKFPFDNVAMHISSWLSMYTFMRTTRIDSYATSDRRFLHIHYHLNKPSSLITKEIIFLHAPLFHISEIRHSVKHD